MSRIQVAGHSRSSVTALRVIAYGMIAVGLLMMALHEFGWIIAVVIGGLIALPTEIWATVLRSRRAWVEDTQSGFSFITRSGERAFRDTDLVDIAIESKVDHSQMYDTRVHNKTRLWMQTEPEPLLFESSASQAKADESAPLVGRLIDGLIERTHSRLMAGGNFAGERWKLTRSYIEAGLPGQEERFELQAIEAVDVFDSHVCIWRRGAEQAAVKIPVASRNACVLPALAQRLMPPRDTQDSRMTTSGLGRVLFERKGKVAGPVILAVVITLIGTAFLIGALQEVTFAVGSLVCLLLAAGCVAIAFNNHYSAFRCHERGVRKVGPFRDQTLQYDEVARFTYSAIRQYVNGGYTGTQINITFDPLPDIPGGRIQYNSMVKGGDEDLDALRDHIARVIAIRLAKRLELGESVPWTDNLTLCPDGIEYRPGGILGRKAPSILPYDQYHGFDFHDGAFHLFAKNQPKSIFNEPTSAPNFFPGYFLLHSMLHQPQEAAAE